MQDTCEERFEKLTAEYEAFAYIVSHDLKAPVRAVGNLASWIEEDLDGNFPGDSKANFDLLKDRTQRLTAMIDALLEFSRATRQHLEIYPTDVNLLVEEILSKQSKGNPVKFQVNGQSPVITTYKSKLQFVLEELIRNAIAFNNKATPEIIVNINRNDAFLQIEIADNGPGIPEAAMEKIFTIFYTVAAKDQVNTTGAGLAIANKIINFVNGKLTPAINQSGGLTMTILWPATL